MSRQLNDTDFHVLVKSIAGSSCVLLLGPDLPVPGENGQDRNLLLELTQQLAQDVEGADRDASFPQVAQLFGEHRRNTLEVAVTTFYEMNDPAPETESLFRTLAKIPFHLIISSRQDRYIEQALEDVDRSPHVEDYNFQGGLNERVPMGTAERPVLYYLYGRPDAPDTLVMTEDDVLKFLKAVAAGDPKLPATIKSEFQRPGNTFLFLGFGLRQWHFRIILHVVEADKAKSESYAIEWLPPSQRRHDDNMIGYYKRGFGINLLPGDGTEFVEKLHEKWVAYLAKGTRPTPARTTPPHIPATSSEPREDSPEVFISYASPDVKIAEELYDILKSEGLRVWWDQQDLRVGGEWHARLGKVIDGCNYFVVLQTNELQRQDFTYVNDEVTSALAKQRRKSSWMSFIMPVFRGTEFRIPELEHLHQRTVDTPSDMVALAAAIIECEDERKQRRASIDQ